MSSQRRTLFQAIRYIVTRWYTPVLLGLVLIGGFAWWVFPRAYPRVVSVDGENRWDVDAAPPRREIVWAKAERIEGLLPKDLRGKLITPRLSDGGATLYFTLLTENNKADIFRSRLRDGVWQKAEPVGAINSEADEIGPVVSRDGREIYFYSDRNGGQGGYDLYVSHRGEKGWNPAKNLGEQVNSGGHEYDPAIAPDGDTLYFARSEGDIRNRWRTTLRAHKQRKLVKCDLYRARWRAEEGWTSTEPLVELNTERYNEGAPFVSPNGTFLYFASDRPTRPAEPLNLDLYRARIVEGGFAELENLGTSINTIDDETEPALSPEGFSLLFASNRGGDDEIFRSTATEIYTETEWDTSRWAAVSVWWWPVLMVLLFLTALIAALWYSQGWLAERAVAARFFWGSLLVHALVLLLLWLLPIARTMMSEGEGEVAKSEGTQMFSGELQQSPETGPSVYSKVADLTPLDSVPSPKLARRATKVPKLPEPFEKVTSKLPIVKNSDLPPARVRVVPEPTPEVRKARKSPDLPRRTKLEPLRTARIEPAPAELPQQQTAPEEKSLEVAKLKVERRVTEMPKQTGLPTLAPKSRPTLSKPLPTKFAMPKPTATKQSQPFAKPRSPLVKLERPRAKGLETATLNDSIQTLKQARQATEKMLNPKGVRVSVKRRDAVGPEPTKASSRGSLVRAAPAPVRGVEPLLPAKPDLSKPAVSSRPSKLDRLKAAPIPEKGLPSVEPGITTVAKASQAEEKPLAGTKVAVGKKQQPLPKIDAPRAGEVAGKKSLVRVEPSKEIGKATVGFKPAIASPEGLLKRVSPSLNQLAEAKEPLGMLKMLSLRKEKKGEELIEKLGGSKKSEEAVERGLRFLASLQNPDGSWSLHEFHNRRISGRGNHRSDTAATGLALLPFLGSGYTHESGPYRETVEKGLKWLLDHQQKSGAWYSNRDSQPMYGKGIASIAVCEAYGLTDDESLQGPAQKALDFIVQAQHGQGGWRYRPKDSPDTSVTGWQMMALKSGEMAGLKVPSKTFAGVKRWLDRVHTGDGRFGYTNRGGKVTMTAQGLLSLQYLGVDRDDPRMVKGADYLVKHLPKYRRESSYYWYHATQVMYHMQGKHWRAWNAKLRDMLIDKQRRGGALDGSWDPSMDNWERSGGRLYATAIRILMLEVYYRHLPLYKQLES